jgi:uncharacterized membrane protein (UPF0127 family)
MTHRVVNERTGEVIAAAAWLADKPWPRMVGLLGRSGLTVDEAIILRPGPSIHTMFMRFALDVLFLSREGQVLKVVRAMKPFRFAAARRAQDCIEMQAGCLAEDVLPGDQLRIEQIS